MSSIPPPSVRNLELLESWGLASNAFSYVYRPKNVEEVKECFEIARKKGISVALRGAGCSYGDASLNEENIVLDFTKFNRILNWDVKKGIVTAEPGVTIEQLWKSTLEDGYWPPVVSGTMHTTLGGICAMNIHGKNNFKVGPIGDHIREIEFLLPRGEVKKCSPKENKDLFYAIIGGFGILGVFTKITFQMKKVHSGNIWVEAMFAPHLEEMFEIFEKKLPDSDYLVGWVDCVIPGKHLGRGVIHKANELEPGSDPNPKESLLVSNQGLPDRFMGVFPSSLTYLFVKPFVNNPGMRLINALKFWSSRYSLRGQRYLQSHAGFNFLLDYIPNWKLSYKPGGLIQYQPFIPKDSALKVFQKIIRLSQEAGLPPYLGVLKRHKPDAFLMTHALDGYSLALDYKVSKHYRKNLWDLIHRLDEIVLDAGGKFYFAKDSTLEKNSIKRIFKEENFQKFLKLKKECDPEDLLETNLTRRLFEFSKVPKN